jgi:hypothetical protein
LVGIPDVDKNAMLQYVATNKALNVLTSHRSLDSKHILDGHAVGEIDVNLILIAVDRSNC